MNLRDIVTLFKNHQIQYGLNGDSENQMQELYKWELVSKQNGHPDPNAVDFSKEINSLEFKNLCFSSQITAIRNFVKYEPEEYRKLFIALFDENILLQERIENFTESCKTLWDDKIKAKFTNHTSAMCDERLISCFLTFHNPQKYTFYKNDVYKNLCKLLGVKPRKAGLKLVHFYELLDQYVIPEIEKENELILSINDEIKNNGCIQSMPLTAQTVLWYYNRTLLKNTDTDKEDNENDLVETKIDSTMMYQKYIDLLKESKNLVLTGAPGTGKTFMTQAIAREMGCSKDEMCFVQFHPSYDYTDFVEGLRPIMMSEGQMGFERKDGIFKEFCKKAIKNLIDSAKSIENLSKELSWENKLQQFIDDSIDNDTKFKLSNGSEFTIDEIKGRNIIAHNDSNPKTPLIPINADEIIELLTNDVPLNIVRDIRTYFNRKFGTQPDSYAFIITKAIREMKYKTQVISANKIERKPFVFIIDEINRGEASKIFGELFYAIDPGYRGKKDIRVKTQYQNLVPETDVFAEEGFYIPENVFILGTMNDIDRSIESMDFAMRRRFTWKEIKPKDTQSMLDKLECATKAKNVMVRLNNEISKIEGLGPAYQVGPSYFLKLGDNGGNFEKLWNMNIEPLLREYIRGFRKSEEIMEKLRNAYFDTKESNSNINDNELVDEN